MFVDEAKIRVKAGNGGNGCMAFRREKFVPRGGPSGGDGGHGGDVIMESSERHNTLVHFRFNPEYKAERGRHGEGSNKTGREGESIILKVPVGTIVYDELTGELATRLLAILMSASWSRAAAVAAAATRSLQLRCTRPPASMKKAVPVKSATCAWSSSCWPMSAWSAIPMPASAR